ncbi:flippase [bacterium]|nr:flippase [bacterium]
MNVLQRLVLNVSFRGASDVGRRLIGFGFTLFLANTLGASGFGKYGAILAYTQIFAVIVDAGLNSLYAREASRTGAKRQEIMSCLLTIKLILSVVMIALMASVTYAFTKVGWLSWTSADMAPLAFFTLYWVLFSSIDLVNAVYVERQKMAYDAAVNLGHRLLSAGLGVVLVLMLGNVFAISAAYVIAAAAALIATCAIVTLRFKILPLPMWDPTRVKALFFEALPLMAYMLFASMFFRVDVVMLKEMTSEAETGYYAAAFRILEFTMLIPAAAALVILPIFARQFTQNKTRLAETAGNLTRLLFAAGLVMGFILSPLAGEIVPIFGKDFGLEAKLALQIVIWSAPLIYINYILIQLLVAARNQKMNAITAFCCMLLNIGLNYILIPVYGFMGAAAATIATECLLLVLSARFLRRHLPALRLLGHVTRVAAAGVIGGLALLLLRDANPFLACLAALAAFLIGLFVFRGITGADRRLLQELLARRNQGPV